MNEEEKTEIFRDGIFISVTWKEVMVGDICRVEQ
jgi:magnesium-transporting ATPase (P-type)